MPQFTPMPTLVVGDIFTTTRWGYLRDNLNKLLNTGHRTLTVAQFNALTGLEGTKGVVAGDEVYLEVDAANGILWHLVYESTETTYKWRFLGGPPLASFVATQESTSTSAYGALATGGPSVALPRSGDFDVTIGALITENGSSFGIMSYDIGGTGAADGDSVQEGNASSVGVGGSASRPNRKTGLTAVTLTSKYRSSAAAAQVIFGSRFMTVTPVRLV